jgi:hypothetical protein
MQASNVFAAIGAFLGFCVIGIVVIACMAIFLIIVAILVLGLMSIM